MRALSAAELLNVWEHGLSHSPAQRALTLLAAACPETPVEQLGQLSIGQRDARLLELRTRIFGPRFTSIATCPKCGERLEFAVSGDELRLPASVESSEALALIRGDWEVRFRLPNSLDLAALDPAADVEANRRIIFERCLIAAHRDGAPVPANELPTDVIAAVAERMAEADPQADVEFSLTCPQCRHVWQAPLDIVSYFWSEIHAWAGRILREVHVFASAYGWSEADVLALSPWRRQAYLEMIEP